MVLVLVSASVLVLVLVLVKDVVDEVVAVVQRREHQLLRERAREHSPICQGGAGG